MLMYTRNAFVHASMEKILFLGGGVKGFNTHVPSTCATVRLARSCSAASCIIWVALSWLSTNTVRSMNSPLHIFPLMFWGGGCAQPVASRVQGRLVWVVCATLSTRPLWQASCLGALYRPCHRFDLCHTGLVVTLFPYFPGGNLYWLLWRGRRKKLWS